MVMTWVTRNNVLVTLETAAAAQIDLESHLIWSLTIALRRHRSTCRRGLYGGEAFSLTCSWWGHQSDWVLLFRLGS